MKKKIFWGATPGAWIASFEKTSLPKSQVLTIPTEVKDLAKCLLEIGGEKVCVPFEEHPEFCRYLTLQGREVFFSKLILKQGKQSDCHQNSIRLWRKDKANYHFVTGYGLTQSDQMWRRHSWVVDAKGYILETTLARSKYYGTFGDSQFMPFFEKMFG